MKYIKHIILMAFVMVMTANVWGMQVYVHYANGTWPTDIADYHFNSSSGNLIIEIESSGSIGEVKDMIADKSGFEAANITLSFGTYADLDDSYTLAYYNITSESTINMTYADPTQPQRVTNNNWRVQTMPRGDRVLRTTWKQACELAFEKDTTVYRVFTSTLQNPLTNPHNLDVNYSSSNTNVATVATDGTVTVKGVGDATITATTTGNNDYQACSASYNITVVEPKKLTLIANGDGTVQIFSTFPTDSIISDTATYDDGNEHYLVKPGTPVTILAHSCDVGCRFVNWTDPNNLYTTGVNTDSGDNPTNSTLTLTVTSDTTAQGNFAPSIHTLTLVAGEHGMLDVYNTQTGVQVKDAFNETTRTRTYTVNYGTEVVLQATPADHHHLASWSNGATLKELDTIHVTVAKDSTIIANFAIDTFKLTLAKSGNGAVGIQGVTTGSKSIITSPITVDYCCQSVDNEGCDSLFDGVITGTNKWGTNAAEKIVRFHTAVPVQVNGYTLYTGNDNADSWGAGRNPKNWVLKAKSGDEWITIANVSNDNTMQNVNYTPFDFNIDVPGTYQYFSFEVSEIHSGNFMQLGEMQLFYQEKTLPTGITPGATTNTYIVNYGTEVTVKATADEHNHFVNWTNEGNTAYNATNVTTDAGTYPVHSYLTFNVTGDTTAQGNFAVNTYDITATVATNCDGMGTVSGGGTYNEAATVTLIATPATGYHFVNWTKTGETSPVSTAATYSFNATAATEGSYIANFAINTYTLTLATDPTNGSQGTLDVVRNNNNELPAGVTGTYPNYTVNEGVYVPLVIAPATHYHLVSLIGGTNQPINYSDNHATIAVNKDTTITATFSIDTYVITAAANNSTLGTVSGGGTYNHGVKVTLTATATDSTHFVNWTKEGETNPVSTTATYNFTAEAAGNYTANFAINPTLKLVADGHGTVDTVGVIAGVTLKSAADKEYYVVPGTVVSVKAKPDAGFVFVQWNDGKTANPLDSTIFSAVHLTATFELATPGLTPEGEVTVQGNRFVDEHGKIVGRPRITETGEIISNSSQLLSVVISSAYNGLDPVTIYYKSGDTWVQALNRPENAGCGIQIVGNQLKKGGYSVYQPAHNLVNPNSEIKADIEYHFGI